MNDKRTRDPKNACRVIQAKLPAFGQHRDLIAVEQLVEDGVHQSQNPWLPGKRFRRRLRGQVSDPLPTTGCA